MSPRPAAATFIPDWASPPGHTLADLLKERGWSARGGRGAAFRRGN